MVGWKLYEVLLGNSPMTIHPPTKEDYILSLSKIFI